MVSRSIVVQAVGSLALVAMLALASPGVRVARAEPGELQRAAPSPSLAGLPSSPHEGVCRVDESQVAPVPRRGPAISAHVVERLRQEMASGDGEFVSLNGRGYNYRRGPNPASALALIDAEAKAERREAER